MQKFLVIQTAFIGDVVLATGILEKLHLRFPDAQIDMLVRKGNEALLRGHPFLHDVLVWDKKKNKLRNLWRLIIRVRREKYNVVVNVQRFAATGLLTALSGAGETIGFDKNPWSGFFTRKVPHIVSQSEKATQHEIDRNQALIEHLTGPGPERPRLYPSKADEAAVAPYRHLPYITISPASVWFTKQYPPEKWISFLKKLRPEYKVILLGAPSDQALCESILKASSTNLAGVINLAGKLSFLESAILMMTAVMNYVNDSAPMHFASAVNAPVTAVFCSTIPAFGFGPLSDRRFIVEIQHSLECRPCGLHGYRACPQGHFRCAKEIKDEQLLDVLRD